MWKYPTPDLFPEDNNTTADPRGPSVWGLNHLITHTHTQVFSAGISVDTGDYNLQPRDPSQKQAKQMSVTFTMTITNIKNKLK